MKRNLNIFVALLLAVVLVAYMATYTVRFNEAVIVTTFGSAGDGSVKNAPGEAGASGEGAGLHFKLPWPVQQVAARFDTRVQVTQGVLEQIQTRDGQSVVLQFDITWRVADPLEFYRTLRNPREAQRALTTRARDALRIVGDFDFDELKNTDPTRVRLAEIGDRARQQLQGRADELGNGIRVEQVGVQSVRLPSAVTEAVFARMASERQSRAGRAQAEGQSGARRLETEATTTAQTIRSFVERAAAAQRQEGEQRAAELITRFREAPELAAFLADVDALSRSMSDRTTFIIDADLFYPFKRMSDILRGRTGQTEPTTSPPAFSADVLQESSDAVESEAVEEAADQAGTLID
jgi:membrane protease subunit HflC